MPRSLRMLQCSKHRLLFHGFRLIRGVLATFGGMIAHSIRLSLLFRRTFAAIALMRGNPVIATGIVRFYNPDKGFGFISPDGGGSEVFVHVSAVESAGLDALHTGERLRYTPFADRQGRHAASGIERV